MKIYVLCRNNSPFEAYAYEIEAEGRKKELQNEYEEYPDVYSTVNYLHIEEIPFLQ